MRCIASSVAHAIRPTHRLLAFQDVLDGKLAAERDAVESLQSQADAARKALQAERSLVSQLKEEASVAAAASQQLMALEQQVISVGQRQ